MRLLAGPVQFCAARSMRCAPSLAGPFGMPSPDHDKQTVLAEADALVIEAEDLIDAALKLIDRAERLLTETDAHLPPAGP